MYINNSLRLLTMLAVFAWTSGCMSAMPATYKSVGSINNEPAKIAITRQSPIGGTSAEVFINGEGVLTTKRQAVITNNPNCSRLSLYRYRCEDSGEYNGKPVTVVEEWSANMYAGYAHFDVFVDGDLVQRVVADGGY